MPQTGESGSTLWARTWARVRSWWRADLPEPPAPLRELEDRRVLQLPEEPYVFECGECGKVFEARRRRPSCPECDGAEVILLSA